jgi:hypothetical protein
MEIEMLIRARELTEQEKQHKKSDFRFVGYVPDIGNDTWMKEIFTGRGTAYATYMTQEEYDGLPA